MINEIGFDENPCQCLDEPLPADCYSDVEFIGVDETEGRFGEVSIIKCNNCSRYWLKYSVEYEYLTGAGRYFMGIILPQNIRFITPETAISYLDTLDWRLFGGSYFGKKGKTTDKAALMA
jgi:hypothetical protein